MLRFFRKNQKGLFGIVGVLLVASFALWGVQDALLSSKAAPQDSKKGVAIDGSVIWKKDIDLLKRFLLTDSSDQELLLFREMPNMLSDGIFKNDIIATGLGKTIADTFLVEIKPDLSKRIEKMRRFKPYVHAYNPAISLENIWGYVNPELKTKLAEFKKLDNSVTPQHIDLLLDLFEKQQSFPPAMARQFLHMQERQMRGHPDPLLQQETLSLFRAKTAVDWFGDQYIDVVAQVIHNGAILAQQNGYNVSDAEVKEYLHTQAKKVLARELRRDPNPGEIVQFIQSQSGYLQMTDQDVKGVLKKVLLLRKWREDTKRTVFADTLAEKNYQEVTQKTATIDIFHFDSDATFAKQKDLYELQLYLQSVAEKGYSKTTLKLPEAYADVDTVAAKAPGLVEQTAKVVVWHVNKEMLLQEPSPQDVWEYQVSKVGYDELSKKFPAKLTPTGKEEKRVEFLEALSDQEKREVEAVVREKLLNQEGVKDALEGAEPQDKTLILTQREEPLPGITDLDAFVVALQEETVEGYTQDNENFYTIKLKEQITPQRILTFAEAQRKGVLAAMLKDELQAVYNNGTYEKPFDAVSDSIAETTYAPLLRAIKTAARKTDVSHDDYTKLRFAALFNQPEEGKLVGNDLFDQWRLVKETVAEKESSKGNWFTDEIFTNPKEHTFAIAQDGRPYSYHVKETGFEEGVLIERVQKEQELLAKEVDQENMNKMVTQLHEAGIIQLEAKPE